MSIKYKLISSFVFSIIAIYVFSTIINSIWSAAYTFTGRESFDNLQDAISFQFVIAQEAISSNATVEYIELTSPNKPEVTFSIRMIDYSHYEYGKRVLPRNASIVLVVLFSIISMSLLIYFNKIIWRYNESNN